MNNTKVKNIVKKLKSLSVPESVAGMARYGIVSKTVYGVCMPTLKSMAKEIGKNHELAHQLWQTEIFDARIIAIFIEEPTEVTEEQIERWVSDFDNWAICDGACLHLFDRTPLAWKKALAWSKRKEEFVKRAGFALMAVLAVHDKKANDKQFEKLLPVIKREVTDERNYVRKAVNWALRQIGKRNLALNQKAIETAKEIQSLDSKSARWVASDALKELQSETTRKRLHAKEKKIK
ncbi:MAG: DNA alkylation repair protein [Ignavibacteriae bacterium]|nr:DNA alkylation repair protein [Ignavibacteriota bacterium]